MTRVAAFADFGGRFDRNTQFDLYGRPKMTFGRLGQGPGEFNRPVFLYDLGDQGVGVLDIYAVSRFNGEGVFQKRIPHKGTSMWKVANGWVWGSKYIQLYPDRGRLWIGGPKFENETLLAAWGEPDDIPGGIPQPPRSTCEERTLIQVDGTAETLFLPLPFTSEIQITDISYLAPDFPNFSRFSPPIN